MKVTGLSETDPPLYDTNAVRFMVCCGPNVPQYELGPYPYAPSYGCVVLIGVFWVRYRSTFAPAFVGDMSGACTLKVEDTVVLTLL